MAVGPQDMAALQAAAGKGGPPGQGGDPSGGAPPAGGDVTKLAQALGNGLSQFAKIIEASPSTTPEDKQQMEDILDAFVDLVERALAGANPGENAPPAGGPMRADQGQVPMEGGMNGVPESMAVKN